MAKTIQIRDLDDEVYAGLSVRAAEDGLSVPELLRREAARIAREPSMAAWLALTRRTDSAVTRADVIDALDEVRGDWHDDRR